MRNFSKSLNPKNIDKSVSDIRIRLPAESSFWISVSGCKLTILPDIQPANRIVIISGAQCSSQTSPWSCRITLIGGPAGWRAVFPYGKSEFSSVCCTQDSRAGRRAAQKRRSVGLRKRAGRTAETASPPARPFP